MNISKIVILLFLLPGVAGITPVFAVDSEEAEATEPVISTVLREQMAVWPDGEAIVTRLELPGNFKLGEHYHPGEEILYVIKGEGWIHFPDKPDVQLFSGEAARIPARQVHSGSAGEEGLQAIVFRVHVKGQPVRIDVIDNP